MPLNNKCRMGLAALPPPHTYSLVISIETESGSCRSLSILPEVGKIPIGAVCDSSAVVVLMVTCLFYLCRPVVSEWLPLIPSDVWEVVSDIESILVTFWVRTRPL
ncbi:hypothetical protein TNCV_3411071 [Trichonephila clavipes]|nr:hypothetical protein TNCV_3411071 [Trichonephila clavipes]